MKTATKVQEAARDRLYSEFQFQLRRGDRIIRRIDDFPELSKALRDGDLSTARMICARLFGSKCATADTQTRGASAVPPDGRTSEPCAPGSPIPAHEPGQPVMMADSGRQEF